MTLNRAVTLPEWAQLMRDATRPGHRPAGIRTIRTWATLPDFPTPVPYPERPRRYRLAELDAWISGN